MTQVEGEELLFALNLFSHGKKDNKVCKLKEYVEREEIGVFSVTKSN